MALVEFSCALSFVECAEGSCRRGMAYSYCKSIKVEPMKRNVTYKIVLIIFCSFIMLAGCTRNIQVSTNLPFKNPQEGKINQKMLVVMSKEQTEAIILEKPGALADTFKIEAGKSISSNLTTAMKTIFERADFVNELRRNGDPFDYYILARYKNYKIEWGSTAFSPVTMNIYIDYDLLDARKEKVLAVSTDGSSTWQRAGGEAVAIINPFVNIFVTNSALGQAWDQAVANSISQWMSELQKHFKK